MSYEHKPGQGSIFKNENKTEPNHADYQGVAITPDGVECWVNLWVKRPEGKKPFFAMRLKPKEPKPVEPEAIEAEVVQGDLPF